MINPNTAFFGESRGSNIIRADPGSKLSESARFASVGKQCQKHFLGEPTTLIFLQQGIAYLGGKRDVIGGNLSNSGKPGNSHKIPRPFL